MEKADVATKAISLLGLVMAAAVVTGVSGCATLTAQPPSQASAPLATAELPDSVPPVPLGGELQVAKRHFRTGNFGYAARYYEQVVAANDAHAEGWLGLAASYDRLGRFDLADRAYLEAAILAGTSAAYHNNVGFSYLLRGDAAKARRSFARALEIAPDDVTVRNNLQLLEDSGRQIAGGAHAGLGAV